VKRTAPGQLVLLAAVGGASLWLVEAALTSTGRAIVVPPFALAFVLALMGVIVVALAWPVRKVTRGEEGAHVDPFYATRVVMLAKASSLSGALLAGAALGIAGYLLSRSIPPIGSLTMALTAAVGAGLLLAGGLVAEHMCSLPPDDDEPSIAEGAEGAT